MTHLQPSATACEDPHINPRANRTQHWGISAWVSSHVRAEKHHIGMASRAIRRSFVIADTARRLGHVVRRGGRLRIERRRANEVFGATDMYPAPGLAMTHLQPFATACEDPRINPRADRT